MDPFGMIGSFFSPEKGYKKAMQQNQQGWNQAQQYQRPYWQQGLDQYGRLNDATGALLDPTKLQNQWSEGYQTSPYAQRMLEMNQGQGLDAASAMGLMGSSASLGNIQKGAGDIVSRDRQQYMNDLMQKYMAGIGLGSNMYGIGAGMGQSLGQGAQRFGENQAGLAFGQQNSPGQLFGNLLGFGGNLGLNFLNPGTGKVF